MNIMTRTAPKERERLAERLSKMLATTVERGATESEAMVAATMARNLMSRHDMTYASAEAMAGDEFVADSRQWFPGRNTPGRIRAGRKPCSWHALDGIAEFCGVSCAVSDVEGALMFFGTSAEVTAAHYFEEMIRGAIERSCAEYRKHFKPMPGTAVRTQSVSYKRGMATRIGMRLRGMARENERDVPGSATALVIAKNELREREFNARYMLSKHPRGRVAVDANAATAGFAAGASVPLSKGIDAPTTAPKSIKDDRRD